MMVSTSGVPRPGRSTGETAAACVDLADLVTGVFQLDSVDGGALVVAAAVGLGVAVAAAVSSGAGPAGSTTAETAGSGAVVGTAGAGDAGSWTAGGGTGGADVSEGLPDRDGRGRSGSSVGSSDAESPGSRRQSPSQSEMMPVAGRRGTAASATAAPAVRRPAENEMKTADAAAETARRAGEDRTMSTFRCVRPPSAPFGVPRQSATPRRRPQILRICGRAAPGGLVPVLRRHGDLDLAGLSAPHHIPAAGNEVGADPAQRRIEQAVALDVAGVEQEPSAP